MKIQVGKTYKTRGGNKVFISTVISNEPLFKYYGVFETGNNKGHGQHYTERGGVSLTRDSDLDIVGLWRGDGCESGGDYSNLKIILNRAYDQAASGKGKERHANDKPFNQQPIAEIGRMVGTGYNLGQVMKKAQEAQGMANRGETDAAVRELLGVIVYAASAIMIIEEKDGGSE